MRLQSNRLMWADLARILAIFMIVYQHLCPAYYQSEHISDRIFVSCFVGCTEWCVPILFMISGAFLLNPRKEFSTKIFFKKNVFRLSVALVFWGIVYGIYSCIFVNSGSWTIFSIVGPIVYKRLPWYHLWFLYTMLGIYVMVPILRILIKNSNRRIIEYIVILFIISSIIEMWNIFMPKCNFSIPAICGYLGYFILGHYLFEYDFSKAQIKAGAILSALSIIALIAIQMIQHVPPRTYFNAVNNPFVIIISCEVIILLKSWAGKEKKSGKILFFLQSVSFGVYLIHDLFIQLSSKIAFPESAFFDIPLRGLFVLICSISSVYLIRKIPVVGKLIT